MSQRVDPTTKFVRSLDGEFIMLREAAEMLDLSHSTLRKYISEKTEGLQPSKAVMFGKVLVYLYTKEDVDRMRGLIEKRREIVSYANAGRPRKYTDEQRIARSKIYSRRTYWRSVAERAEYMEDDVRLDHALKVIQVLEAELADE
jgi:predicted transcriptional regulator